MSRSEGDMLDGFIKLIKNILILYFISFIPVYSEEVWKGACEANFPPYNYIKDGKMVGMDTEIVELVMHKIGVKYTKETYPWQTVVNYLEDNEIDFVWQMVETKERRNKFILIGPIREGIMVFMVRTDSNLKDWKKLEDFKLQKIGVVKGFNYTKEFDQNNNLNKVEFTNNHKLIQKLLEKDVDVIIGDLATLTYEAKEHEVFDKVRFLPSSIKKVPRFVAFSKKNINKSILFQQGLNNVIKSQEYKDIIDKYSKLKIK
ncbi:substrate-binding periplasmic protein [Fluviispira vulneris]|uniref:substrate-binding periplasmic protein n=1 Tax=Fluviispira vulneris TaxID=2763012 RepID=UPI001643FF33|nr:transporter substrate-binding domain-containing protein [Fluviispira vulneris]